MSGLLLFSACILNPPPASFVKCADLDRTIAIHQLPKASDRSTGAVPVDKPTRRPTTTESLVSAEEALDIALDIRSLVG